MKNNWQESRPDGNCRQSAKSVGTQTCQKQNICDVCDIIMWHICITKKLLTYVRIYFLRSLLFLAKVFYVLQSCKTTISLGWAQSSSKKHHLSTMSTRVLKRKYLVLIWWFSLRTAVLQRYHGHLNKMFGSDFPFSCHMKLNWLFMCQDENENEPNDESFPLFWIISVTNEPGCK